ncbi:MAG: ferredoxin--NADP reductase [Acidimicrobiales bacterium]
MDSGRWAAADDEAFFEPALVIAVERGLGATVLRLRLDEVAQFLPGQYYLVSMAIDMPPGTVQQAYSVCSSPYPPSAEIELAVREVPGGRASPLLARQVGVGDLLQVRGPFGFLTWTEQDGGPLGLVGAGSGVAPLASIVRYAAARHVEIPITLLCSSRSRETVLLARELTALRRLRWFRLAQTYTRSPQDGSARYHRRIDAAMLADVMGTGAGAGDGPAPTSFYLAGPAEMVLSAREAIEELAIPEVEVYSEDHA